MNDVFEIDEAGLQALIDALAGRGYRVIGPTMGDGAVVYDEIAGVAGLPRGVIDHQDGGHYRIEKTVSGRLFDHVVGPHSWKKYLFPPKLDIGRVRRAGKSFEYEDPDTSNVQYAFIGARACELAAIAIQDKVFMGGPYVDRHYQRRRENAFIVAVQCGRAGGTCFCASVGTGPRARSGYDLALTELDAPDEPGFAIEIGSELGREVLESIPHRPARAERAAAAEARVEAAAGSMGRTLNPDGLPQILMNSLESPRWDQVAERCLSCANCTMVCPTCFCSTVDEVNDLRGEVATRTRLWDSCFSMEFSHLHGGGTRPVVRDRYRQWMTHKLSTWTDQFGMLGCVGCGRCITWCPTAIDITEESAKFRADAELRLAGECAVDADASGDARREKSLAQIGVTPSGVPVNTEGQR